jgi:hypothetical protein
MTAANEVTTARYNKNAAAKAEDKTKKEKRKAEKRQKGESSKAGAALGG